MPTDLPDAAGATDVPGYRPVSVLAVFALIAGMLGDGDFLPGRCLSCR